MRLAGGTEELEEGLARAARIHKRKEPEGLQVLRAEPEMPLRQEGLEVHEASSASQPGLGLRQEGLEALACSAVAVRQEGLEVLQQWPEGQTWLQLRRQRLEVPEALAAAPRATRKAPRAEAPEVHQSRDPQVLPRPSQEGLY